MKNKFKYISSFFVLTLFFFIINFFNVINDDLIWNYGFCSNFTNGMTMYTDYNMVITPFYPFFIGTIMKLFGNNMIIFYLANSVIATIIMFLILKLNRQSFIPTMLLLSFVSVPNYNLLCILLLFVLIYLEKEKKNDYLIGFILGITFLTKSSVGLFLCFPSIYYLFKNFRKLFRRIIGFLIPNLFVIIIFYLNRSLMDYINYCFLGLFEFAGENTQVSGLILVIISFIVYLIKKFLKNKDITIIYILCFQIISFPIFNGFHVMYASIPVLYYIFANLPKKVSILYKQYNKVLLSVLICPLIGTLLIAATHDFKYDNNTFKYRYVDTKYYNNAKIIDSVFDGKYENVYFIMYSAYLNKYLLDIPINNYDLLLKGNLGYNGETKIIDDFSNMDDVYFILYNNFEGGQASKKIYDYIKSNTNFITSIGSYVIYYKN